MCHCANGIGAMCHRANGIGAMCHRANGIGPAGCGPGPWEGPAHVIPRRFDQKKPSFFGL